MKKQMKQRILDLFERTIDNGYEISNKLDLEDLDFYSLYSKSVQNNCSISFDNDNLFSVIYKYHNDYGILIIYMINNMDTNKKISEKVINIIGEYERLFTTLDYAKIQSNDVSKENNSATYLVIYKNLNNYL